MLEMARTNLYNLTACLFLGLLAESKKNTQKKQAILRERIDVTKCLSCFYWKLIREIGRKKKNIYKNNRRWQKCN